MFRNAKIKFNRHGKTVVVKQQCLCKLTYHIQLHWIYSSCSRTVKPASYKKYNIMATQFWDFLFLDCGFLNFSLQKVPDLMLNTCLSLYTASAQVLYNESKLEYFGWLLNTKICTVATKLMVACKYLWFLFRVVFPIPVKVGNFYCNCLYYQNKAGFITMHLYNNYSNSNNT